MSTLAHHLEVKFTLALRKAFPALSEHSLEGEITQSTQEKFGHYQCNSAMKLSKELRANPRQIAEKIVENVDRLEASEEVMIASLEVAGAGFINITLDAAYLSRQLQMVCESVRLGISLPKKPQRIVVDFSCPNTAKEMHVGHLRSTIIGDSLARLFEFLGDDVLRLNHIGDWGTSFGMLIAYMKEEVPQVLKGELATDLTSLAAWYKAARKQFEVDPLFKARSQREVVALQGGDKDSLLAWSLICEISRKAYQEIYDLLDVKLIERGESFYNPLLPGIVADLEAKGMITVSDGAKCIFLEGFKNRDGEMLPLMVQKSDGGYNYDTTDMAAIRQRIEEEKADRILYVTDAGQSTHYQLLFKAAEKAGYLDPSKVRVEHVSFGLVLGLDGKKYKTRSGETEKLIDLLNTAVEHAKKLLKEREHDLNESELEKIAVVLGINAVKYADLSCHRVGDYMFSYERMLRFEGNTAAFLMYAYVRILGIKRKVKVDIDEVRRQTHIILEHPAEIALGLHLLQFGEALEIISRDLLPNRLTDYLYVLAEKFNAFFRDCRVEGTPQQNNRLLLCEAVARTMKQGLEILGLKTVDRM